MERISKENYYLDIAETVLERATCLRRVYGAIIVKRRDMAGGDLYLVGRDAQTGELLGDATSCSMCRRLIINAGLTRVVIRRSKTEFEVIPVSGWVDEDDTVSVQ